APTVLPNNPPTVTVTSSSARVTLAANCGPEQRPDPNCTPTSSTVQLTANATDPDGDTLLYTWTTTGGRITGDGPNVTWDLSGVSPGTYTANVEVDDGCGCMAFSSTTVTVDTCGCEAIPTPMPEPTFTPTPTPTPEVIAAPTPSKFDEYGNIPRNDVKARLDNFANELQANPGSQGYIIAYGGRVGPAGEAQRRADFARDYLVNNRQIEAGRLVTIDGGFKEEATTELWIVPTGAPPPTASPTVDPSEVRTTRPASRRRRRGRDDDE
ncbi:MAG: PKD domain-containing protein, partial [Acidobacteria bacterium]|nr:PKD domain-containing protein [Acidobacteriota bacterium]